MSVHSIARNVVTVTLFNMSLPVVLQNVTIITSITQHIIFGNLQI